MMFTLVPYSIISMEIFRWYSFVIRIQPNARRWAPAYTHTHKWCSFTIQAYWIQVTYNPINVFGQFSNAHRFRIYPRYNVINNWRATSDEFGWYIPLDMKCCVNNTLQAQLNFNRNKWKEHTHRWCCHWAFKHSISSFVTLFHYDSNDMLLFISNEQRFSTHFNRRKTDWNFSPFH